MATPLLTDVTDTSNTPPDPIPVAGTRYRVGTSPGGDWSSKANKIAESTGSGWAYTTPDNGSVVWDLDAQTFFKFATGSGWADVGDVAKIDADLTLLAKHGSETVTLPGLAELEVVKGFRIFVASGKTLTHNGTIHAGPYEIFVRPGDPKGTVGFGSNIGTAYPEWFGAAGDGSTPDSDAIQAAIDAFSQSGAVRAGTVQFLPKCYICNITLKSWITLRGHAGGNAVTSTPRATRLQANENGGTVVDTPSEHIDSPAVENMIIVGRGATKASQGLKLRNVDRGRFENLALYNFADEAIEAIDADICHFNKIFAQASLLDRTRSSRTGVVHFGPECCDNFIGDSEFNASLTGRSDQNMYLAAVYVEGCNNTFSRVIGEISDIGLVVKGSWNRFVDCRADLNFCHGFFLEQGATYNTLSACLSLRNARETSGDYDGFHVESGTWKNLFTGCQACSLQSDQYKHRYGFFDWAYSNSSRNAYVGCMSSNHATRTAEMYPIEGSDFQVVGSNFRDATDKDTTPSVDNQEFLRLNYTEDTEITNFTDGVPGQEISIIATGSEITIKHSFAAIWTATGADQVLEGYKVYKWRRFDACWHPVV